MSSQFSYELDERQIRLLMQDSELDYEPGAWDRFEQTVLNESKPHSNTFSPKLNLAISRSVIVPVIFIILIGGLSAMLFSFVDFKKKDDVKKETALLPLTKSETKTPVVKKTRPLKTETVIEPITIKPETAVTQTLQTSIADVKSKPTIVVASSKEKIAEIPKENMSVVSSVKNEQSFKAVKRKRKKDTSEEIPIINTSTTDLNAGNAEPELELR